MMKKINLIKYFVVLLLTLSSFVPLFTNAMPEDRLKGYAWSDGAGWISFNCSNTDSCSTSNYGVTADASGNLSGYAWSDNFGWLSFNSADTLGITEAVAPKINLGTGEFSGHALFISASDDNTDGWIGLVSLNSADAGYPVNYKADLNLTSYEVEGWGWGDVNTGWVSFNCLNDTSCATADYQVTYDPFYFLFTANQGLSNSDKVPYNGSVVLSWTTDGANGSCTASDGGTTDWTTNPSGATKALGEPSTVSQTISNITTSTKFTLSCSNGAGHNLVRSLDILVNPPAPVINITAGDTNITSGASTNLSWTGQNVNNCVATGAWSGAKADSGTESTGALFNDSLFTISCDSDYPASYPAGANDSVQVDVERLEVNLRAEKLLVPFNDKVVLYYSTEFPIPNSCVATGDVPGWAGSAINETPGEHTFTSVPITTEDVPYWATLECDGSNSQNKSATVNINIRKNPNYQEI